MIYSLHRGKYEHFEKLHLSSDSTIRDIFSRLDQNGSELDDVSSMTHLNLEWSIRENSLKDLMTNIDQKISMLDTKGRISNDKTLPLKLKDKVKVKDFNVNINLNFRVVKDENSHSAKRKKDDKLFSIPSSQALKKDKLSEKRNTSDSIKLVQEIKGKFNKKVQPAQYSASKKTSVDREYKIVNDPYKTGMYTERSKANRVSNTGLLGPSKVAQHLKIIPATKSTTDISKDTPLKQKSSQPAMKIHNFDKVLIVDPGSEAYRFRCIEA